MITDVKYCRESKRLHRHGILHQDRRVEGDLVYGQCAYCKQTVRGDARGPTQFEAVTYIIEEVPW